jgi:Ca2+-binding EF-hand superfamily protein
MKKHSSTTSTSTSARDLARRNSNVFALFDQKQISELKEAFSFIDQNGDGIVDREDLQEVFQSLGKCCE